MHKKAGILPAFFYVLYNGVKVVFSPPLIYNIISNNIMEVKTMKKRAFTLIEVLVAVMVILILFVMFTAITVNKVGKEIDDLESKIEEYNRQIEYYKEDN